MLVLDARADLGAGRPRDRSVVRIRVPVGLLVIEQLEEVAGL